MVFFNYSTMQMAAKVVYYGPGLCGKTTNLQWIFDHTNTDSRGEMVSLATETDRTLFFDLLPIDVGTIAGFNTRIQLYTVPGQVFYNTTRKLVLKGVDGVVFVADSQAPMLQANIDSFANLEENLAEMGLTLETIPVVLQFNKRDLPGVLSPEELNKALNRGDWPWAEASAIQGDGVFETLKLVSKATLMALKKRLTKGRSEGGGARPGGARPGGASPRPPLPKAPLKPPLPPRPASPKPAIASPPEGSTRPPLPRPPPSPPSRSGPLPRSPLPKAPPPAAGARPSPPAAPESAPADILDLPEAAPVDLEPVEAYIPAAAAAGAPEPAAAEPARVAPEGVSAADGLSAEPEPGSFENLAPPSVPELPEPQPLGDVAPELAPEPAPVDEPLAAAPETTFESLPQEEPAVEFELDDDQSGFAQPARATPSESVAELQPVAEPESASAAPEPVAPEPVAPEPVAAPEPVTAPQLPAPEVVPAPAPAAMPVPPAAMPVPPAAMPVPPAAAPAPARVASPSAGLEAMLGASQEAAPRRRKPRAGGGIDALAELEKLRRQALHPKPSKSGLTTTRSMVIPAAGNGQEISREVVFDLAKSDLQRASRFSLTLQLEDQDRQVVDQIRQVHVDIDSTKSFEKLLLHFNVALKTKET